MTNAIEGIVADREHQVLRRNRAIDQSVDLSIEGKVVARRQLVSVDDHFAMHHRIAGRA
ncbi:hypothetical protein QTI04_03800 [Variovorax sp. J22R115]|nr:hypothetical protein [Variovorax sp. J22R115]